MLSNKKSKKTYGSQVNTEKIYLFRKVCEELYKERNKGFFQKIKQGLLEIAPNWWDIQMGLGLIELYEETSVEELRKHHKALKEKIWKIKSYAKSTLSSSKKWKEILHDRNPGIHK